MSTKNAFAKSDIGAQAAWKGFSSQTLYIASRIITDTDDNCYYPEDIEDLVVKKDGKVIEAIQVKNIVADLTISSLASTKSSVSGEGFFKRVCSLHAEYPIFDKVKVVYFGSLGAELNGLINKNKVHCDSIKKKLIENHKLSDDNASWLISSLIFEKADISKLEQIIHAQVKEYVETMAAPEIAKSLLIQHVSDLSKSKGFISKKSWREQIHKIGIDLSSVDGYFKVYNKSLIRLSELSSDKKENELKHEFEQGISTHPDHIRSNIDFRRKRWSDTIAASLKETNTVIVKGVSGQGKTAICYRYLLDNYPEELIFCVRHISSTQQAENLVSALSGISKHTQNLVVYIDVNPGETNWALLVQELIMRKVNFPILVSIRDEDFNLTPVNGSMFAYKLIEVQLTEDEGRLIYNHNTFLIPHSEHRTFEEAWSSFGGKGPLIEFTYFLTNNQTLKERLQGQINSLLLERVPDAWFDILKVVCLAGKIGGAVYTSKLKRTINCDTFSSAIQRFTDEYLIKEKDDKSYIEALHPIRAKILDELLTKLTANEPVETLLNCITCINAPNVQYLLMEFFTENDYSKETIARLPSVVQNDWVSFAGTIKAMLWIDTKRYYENNRHVVSNLIKDKGKGWLPLMPLDISGLIRPNELILEKIAKDGVITGIDNQAILKTIENIKESLSSIHIDFESTDSFILTSAIPDSHVENDDDCDALGYSLFWLAKRNCILQQLELSEISWNSLSNADFQLCANAVRGLFEHTSLVNEYNRLKDSLLNRFLTEYCTVVFTESQEDVICKFVPPVFINDKDSTVQENFNHYWKIKALDIIQQIYPQKEYIEIELLGIDLLGDLGIEPLDYKVRIHKSNRNDRWITEINSWFISRVYYAYRPTNWSEYVSKIEEIRKVSNTLVEDAIQCVDYLYKKQFLSKERWAKVNSGIKRLNSLTSNDILLPTTVVDKYCLFREDMQSDSKKEKNKISIIPLQYNKYKKWKTEFTNTYFSIENFFNHLPQVLLPRIQKTTFEGINLNLGLLNLFETLKSIVRMQMEFDSLFQNYSSIKHGFNQAEVENLNILLNVWHHVIENQPRGYPIVYAAKQKYRNAIKIVESLNNIVCTDNDIQILSIEKKVYLLKPFDLNSDEMGLECEKVTIKVNKQFFNNASIFSSERWYIDCRGYEFIYTPVYNDIPMATGFSIPSLQIFGEQTKYSMYPALVSKMIFDSQNIDFNIIEKCTFLSGILGTFKILIHQYNEIVSLDIDDGHLYENGLVKYLQSFVDEMGKCATNLGNEIGIINTLSESEDDLVVECISAILQFLNQMGDLLEFVQNAKPIEELEVLSKNAIGAFTILQSFIVKKHQK